MLRKYSIFMMLLLATGSLVGISSIYQPTNVETQPQQQPQRLTPGQKLTVPGIEGTTQLPRDQQQFLNQAMSDTQLLDRLMPLIINRLDSKMLAQKILPHLTVTLRMGDNYGPIVEVKKDTGMAPASYHTAEARCPPGTRVMGGGGTIQSYTDGSIESMGPIPTQRFSVVAKMTGSGTILAYATCLGEVAIGLKDVQQPQQQSSQPLGPGGLLDLRKK